MVLILDGNSEIGVHCAHKEQYLLSDLLKASHRSTMTKTVPCVHMIEQQGHHHLRGVLGQETKVHAHLHLPVHNILNRMKGC